LAGAGRAAMLATCFAPSPFSAAMKPFPLLFTGLLTLASVLRAANPTITYGGVTYELNGVHESRGEKDPMLMIFTPPDGANRAVKTIIEVVYFPKKKYPDELGRGWLETIFPRAVETPTVHVSPQDKRDVTYEVIAFTQNPNGEEVDLRRFFREPDRGGVTSYLVKWLYPEKDSKVDDSPYRSQRDALIAELQQLKISLDWRPEKLPPPAASPAAEAKPATKS
jgi:hypothetical protein